MSTTARYANLVSLNNEKRVAIRMLIVDRGGTLFISTIYYVKMSSPSLFDGSYVLSSNVRC